MKNIFFAKYIEKEVKLERSSTSLWANLKLQQEFKFYLQEKSFIIFYQKKLAKLVQLSLKLFVFNSNSIPDKIHIFYLNLILKSIPYQNVSTTNKTVKYLWKLFAKQQDFECTFCECSFFCCSTQKSDENLKPFLSNFFFFFFF